MERIEWGKEFFFNLYITFEGMYSKDTFTWETASLQRVFAAIDMGTQTNSLKI